MNKKVVFFFIQIIFIIFNLSSFSRKTETVFISNYSSSLIIIDYEFKNGDSVEHQNYIFEQYVNNKHLAIKDELFNRKRFLLKSMQTRYILSYYPVASILDSTDYYEQMADIPFMDKMRAIYKTFTIKDEEGNILLSLNSLGDYIIKKQPMGIVSYYYIEIFDYDLEGKPASEW